MTLVLVHEVAHPAVQISPRLALLNGLMPTSVAASSRTKGTSSVPSSIENRWTFWVPVGTLIGAIDAHEGQLPSATGTTATEMVRAASDEEPKLKKYLP